MIDRIAGRAALREKYVKGERKRLLTRAFMIRVIVLLTLMPDADVREALTVLAGDLAMVPWARPWAAAPARACGDWRNALGPEPLEELRDVVLRASWAEHGDRDWRAVIIGRTRPLKTGVAGRDAISDFQALAHLAPLIGPVPSAPTVWRALSEAGDLQLSRLSTAVTEFRRHHSQRRVRSR